MLKLIAPPAMIGSTFATALLNLKHRPMTFFVKGEEQVYQLTEQLLLGGIRSTLRVAIGATSGNQCESGSITGTADWFAINFLDKDNEFVHEESIKEYHNVLIVTPERGKLDDFESLFDSELSSLNPFHPEQRIAFVVDWDYVLQENFDGQNSFYNSDKYNDLNAVEFLVTMEPEPKYNGWEIAAKLLLQPEVNIEHEIEKMMRL